MKAFSRLEIVGSLSLNLTVYVLTRALAIISEDQRETRDDEWVFSADTITYADRMPSPRYIKSHLPVSLLPKEIWTKKPKVHSIL